MLAAIAYRGLVVFIRARMTRTLMGETKPFERISDDTRKTLLVLGDSTGVGVGAAHPEESVAGRLAAYLGATHVENYAAGGAGVENLPEQIAKAKLPRYDVILLQTGGHNMLVFDDAKKVGRDLGNALAELPEAGKVYVMLAGNAGGAKIFPFIVRPFHTMMNRAYHVEFKKVCDAWGARYVNLYDPPSKDPFLANPDFYLSEDGLHPSSAGYEVWFEKLKEYRE